MEVRIGIKHSPRELAFESNEAAEELRAFVDDALTKAAPVVTLTDAKGRTFLISTDSISYVEIGGETERKVGFIS
ncbi:DUF3107 domain-containing protein [Leucobacter sp. CSA2]|uniref:DUF3107 domain-containing protein n=1 Tax=Leucobacter edaphi TaxID=2796472 RepID=A0A934QBB7_9MICO|nr:DUF3107 domain-containing protein [Leucobacter edaphi]